MEKTAHQRRLRALPVLVLVNTLVFLLQISLPPLERPHFLYLYGLSDGGLMRGEWWQLVTYGFLHGNIWHLLFNMAGLWFAGRIVERVMGTGRFLGLYFASVVAGGLVPVLFGGIPTLLVGASGAVFGVIVAFTTMFPDAQIIALLFYVLPVPLRAKYLGWGVTAISVFFLLTGLLPQISHAAHLGGCVMGYLYTRLGGFGPPGIIERFFLRRSQPPP